MNADGCTPSQQKIRSFLGMVLFYQYFIPGWSRIAKPLYALTAGEKRKARDGHGYWTCESAFENLKHALLNSVVLAHPDFDKPFLLCMLLWMVLVQFFHKCLMGRRRQGL
ncbi:hypothetical protein LDENG_00206460 [Lucifuga dentata]|nr:hypothetical protein LDENG_00206460 [Lucifuga dentata]